MANGLKYAWEDWFKRREFTIKRGRDYGVSQATMAQNVRNAATRHGLRVRVRDLGTSIRVLVVGEARRA